MKKIKIKDSDYLYQTGLIRALENNIVSADKFIAMAQTRDMSDLVRMFEDVGISSENGYDAGIDARLNEAFELAYKISGSKVFDVFRYQYDAHNLKSAIKSALRDSDPTHLFVELGTVETSRIAACVRDRDFSPFPNEMAEAANIALDEYARTSDPQRIDTLIDKACYASMKRLLSDYDFPFLTELTSVRIDLTNILTTIRLMRMKSGYVNFAFLCENLIEGGNIALSQLVSLFERDEEELFRYLSSGEYSALAVYGAGASLSMLERACDDEYMRYVKDNTKYLSYGASVLAAYIVAREYEAKNLRILYASKKAALPTEKITERLRTSYV